MNRPQFWVVGGPNGSGKSSLIRHGALDPWTGDHLTALSPDDIVLDLRKQNPAWSELDLLREAQRRSDAEVDRRIAAGSTVMVETVLSSLKFAPLVTQAKSAGFLFGFAFVTVGSAEYNLARVRTRAAKGGHDVPHDRVVQRRERSHANFTGFAATADVGVVFDNSAATPLLLAERPLGKDWHAFDPDRIAALGLLLPPLDPAPSPLP